ncbi:transmembrane channel-like protein 7 [Aplochiton taeniatus]
MQGKREARDRRKLQRHSFGFWESWSRSQSINRKRFWEQVGGAIADLLPWRRTLYAIEGKFGVGVKAYFVFLRYLVYLNLLHCVIIVASILVPTVLYGRGQDIGESMFGKNDSILDFFLASGYLERSPMFYGFYTRGSLNLPCLNTPLLFLIGMLAILILSLIMIFHRTVIGFKHTWLLGNHFRFNESYKIFCGWNFTVQDPAAATLKHSFIRNDLKLYLEEQRFNQREAQRTLAQWVRLYFLRVILNFLVLTLLGGAFCLIYFATIKSQTKSEHHWLLNLILQYLPPITITTLNMLLPELFRQISAFEDYSLTTQINTTLLRSICLKLSCLGIYLFFLLSSIQLECWETQFGKEMYKLSTFDFLACFLTTFFIDYPRKRLEERFPSSRAARLIGRQYFLITFNVLDLVYSQTVTWEGVFFCPLLTFIETFKLMAMFYIKKFAVLRCCVPEQRMFRASSSLVLFNFLLLMGFLMVAVTLGINRHYFALPLTCGPFGGMSSVFNVTGVCVDSLPGPAQNTLRYMASESIILPIIMAEIVVLTYYVSWVRANRTSIESLKDMLVMVSTRDLKDMLVMCSSDKRFLVKQHATLLRSQRKTKKAPAACQTSVCTP